MLTCVIPTIGLASPSRSLDRQGLGRGRRPGLPEGDAEAGPPGPPRGPARPDSHGDLHVGLDGGPEGGRPLAPQRPSNILQIDTHLKLHMDERHGMKLSGPEDLAGANPGLIVVMSRAFAGEISKIARAQVPHAEIVLYSDLLSRARGQKAA